MSRRYNKTFRERKAYERYLEQFESRKFWFSVKGYTPADPQALSYEDYLMSRNIQRQAGVKPGNITAKIISAQLYRSPEDAQNLLAILEEKGVMEDGKIDNQSITLTKLRMDTKTWDMSLSALNDKLKADGIVGPGSGYSRAAYISYWVFDSE